MERKSSPRPVRKDQRKGLSIWRVPNEGPVTPGLRRRDLTPAIGFTAHHESEPDESE